MSDFFIPVGKTSGEARGVKRKASTKDDKKPTKRRKPAVEDEEIHSSSSDEGPKRETKVTAEEEDPYAYETPNEKRTRLAMGILKRAEASAAAVEEHPDHDAISHRLLQDAIKSTGRFKRLVAAQVKDYVCAADQIKRHRKHNLAPTCLAVPEEAKLIYSGGKDCQIIKWDLESDKKIALRAKMSKSSGHTGHVLALAVSSDGAFLASGGTDRKVRIWDARTESVVETFEGHRDTVAALAFKQNTHTLYSGGYDRVVKLWNLDQLSFIETLFGHEAEIMAIDALAKDRAISAGYDCSARIWKIVEQKQLVYESHKQSVDCVRLINEQNFITGSQDGSIALWSAARKKPLVVQAAAHGPDRWITSVAAVRHTDLVASGSSDGFIRLWETSNHLTTITNICNFEVPGVINDLVMPANGRFIAAAVGQEPRLGRWLRVPEARNAVLCIPLPLNLQGDVEEGVDT